ncbi:MAG TPA: glycoside hydrolase family 15 protein [Acidimicrobiales bacterium]|nr:glycoside hydrolase family 15 protein [Acidimicrobiales bacterium]
MRPGGAVNRIGDYGMIGDCHSLALVGPDGSIDWLCFPRFDSPSVFGRALDADAGHFRVAPSHPVEEVRRTYLPSTNVLETTFVTADGVLELTDAMPVRPFDPQQPTAVATHASVLRRVRCLAGRVTATVDLRPRFEYGTVLPRFTATSPTTSAIMGGPDALWVRASRELVVDRQHVAAGWELQAGEEAWIEVGWTPAVSGSPHHGCGDHLADMRQRFGETVGFWEAWLARCSYRGDHERRVHRSALVLKALTYAPTGAVVAAGTTSLPEWIGGSRNWDYRFTWIRDATLTLASLALLGYIGEAAAFKGWLERTGAGRPEDLQIMYRVTGERLLPELELPHLRGHRDSGPVRIGNAAAGQVQLDSLGQLLEAGYLFGRAGGELTVDNADFLRRVADLTVREWRRPDQGIWEIRDDPRHFVHSKLNCWMALDRAVRLAEAGRLDGDLARWRAERDAVAAWLHSEGSPDGWYVQAAGHPLADAAALLVPALGFLAPADPRVLATIDVVQRDLGNGAHVHRYLSPDGLPGDEGAFLLCSFWLLDALTHAGRLDEAEALLEQLLGMANDVGLYAEMVDPSTGEQLGNTPQAFTHMAVVTSCHAISAARRGQLPPPDQRFSFVEACLDRRLLAAEG